MIIKTPESFFWGTKLPELKPYHLSAECNPAQMWWVRNEGYLGPQNTTMKIFLYLFCTKTIKYKFVHILITSSLYV